MPGQDIVEERVTGPTASPGDMITLVAAKDWSETALGGRAFWPQSLRTVVGLVLASPLAMIVMWGPDFIQIYNDAYAVIAAGRHPRALGQPTRECWPEVWSFNAPIFQAVLSGEAASFFNQKLTIERRTALEDAWFDLTYSPLRDDRSDVAGVLVTVVETTDRVLAERRLASQSERQRSLFELAPGFITILRGPDMIFEFVNVAYRKLFGGRDFIGRTVRDAFPDIADQGFHELLANVYATGERFVANHIRVLLEHPAGSTPRECFLDFIYEPITDEAGNVTGLFVEGYDVTDAHLAQVALREMNADLERRVLERAREFTRTWQVSPDLLGILSPDGRFSISNPAWRAVLGWSADELAQTYVFDLIHPDDVASGLAAFDRLKSGEPLIRLENRYRSKAGSWHWLSWVAVPEDGRFYCSARDVTVEKQREFELKAIEEQLRQAQKMEAVGQLTGGIAHDFNNLLAGITGSLELLQKRVAQGRMAELDRYIDAAQGASKRAAALTHRLLAFSRLQTLDPKPANLNDLVTGMSDIIRRTTGVGVTVKVVAEHPLWTTLVDAHQLENALLNLCINARDAMPDGGLLTIRTANVQLSAEPAADHGLLPGDYVVLSVSDEGTGMTPDVAKRAFDPFFTTKPIGVGTGLGLSMIYGFVRQSDGQAQIESEPGRGTTIILRFPRHLGEVADVQALDRRSAMHPASHGDTVLVVEDEQTVRMLIAEVLEELGYVALEAVDAAGGLQILRSKARVDLLITDVGLPGGMNGRQMADAARMVRPDLAVLFVTGYAGGGVLDVIPLPPGMQVMSKPFTLDALLSKVRDIIERQGRQGPAAG